LVFFGQSIETAQAHHGLSVLGEAMQSQHQRHSFGLGRLWQIQNIGSVDAIVHKRKGRLC
jgi:hypothetical protein